jgi:nitroreductase
MDLIEALRTTGATRSFTNRMVTDEELVAMLDTARFAPSGGNRQPWGVIVARSPELRTQIAECAQIAWREYAAHEAQGFVAFAPGSDGIWHGPDVDLETARNTEFPNSFIDRIADAPALLIITVDLTKLACLDNGLARQSVVGGGSIYPFVERLLLAATAHGLGGVITTYLARQEPQLRSVLGLPDHVAIASMVALGEPVHRKTKLTRRPVSDFAWIDSYEGAELTERDGRAAAG